MQIDLFILFLFSLILVYLVLFIYSLTFKKSKLNFAISLIFIVVFTSLMVLSTSYKDHGGEYFTSIEEMFYRTTNSHYDQSKELEKIGSENLNNSLIVFYRVDCVDCELSYNSIEKELSSINLKKYWVSTRSEYGKTLVKEHDIKNVPSILYVNEYGRCIIFTPYSDSSFNGYIDKSTMALLKMTVEASTTNSKR